MITNPDHYVARTMLEAALGSYGIAEMPGRKHRPEILEYLASVGMTAPWQQRDETPWCSAFINYIATVAGAERTASPAARSWNRVGRPIFLGDAIPGDVVVLSRGRHAWQGHVGLFVRDAGGKIYVLGGNQGNRVCILPYSSARIVGIRRLSLARPQVV